MELEPKNKRALVTGGSSGIGKAIARALACEGVDVALLAHREDVPIRHLVTTDDVAAVRHSWLRRSSSRSMARPSQ